MRRHRCAMEYLVGGELARDELTGRCGSADVLILRALGGDSLHAWTIGTRLRSVMRASYDINHRSLYRMLLRLESGGWLEGEWRDMKHHRLVKHYWLTSKADATLAIESEYWRKYFSSTERLFSNSAVGPGSEIL